MIDSTCETLITFAEAARGLPSRRNGRKTHISTLYRWATAGCKGVILETLQIGGSRCTSREAMQRFFEALTSRSDQAGVVGIARTSAQRKREIEAAGRELDKCLYPKRKGQCRGGD